MKPINSIKWRLQMWYGVILIAVLAGFGVTAHQLERGRVFRRVDDELRRSANLIMNSIRPPRGGPRDRLGGEPPEGGPPFHERRLREGREDGRPPEDFPPALVRPDFIAETDTNGLYYIVYSQQGNNELMRSSNAPAMDRAILRSRLPPGNPPPPPEGAPPLRPPPPPPLTFGTYREIIQGNRNLHIVVGRSIAPELRDLNLTALMLAGVGGIVLLLGLTGGGWIAARAMRPISDISKTATKISAGDLSQRINVADTENELGQLAGVLNSTFSRLETSFSQQRQFTADAAHELRTPITVMLTETQTTLKRERSPEEYRQTVEVCQRITQRMRRLIETLLELARLDAGQEQMKRLRFDLSGTVHECVELVLPLAEERDIKINHDVAAIECVGDSERLSQVVTNLLTNAVQYNKHGGIIRVKLERQGQSAVLSITDNGAGIASEDLPRVFERFYRAEKSRSSGNAGLGLAICKAIVEAHGGTIEAVSKAGEGATFVVRLPVNT